jgi:hypothetical protein
MRGDDQRLTRCSATCLPRIGFGPTIPCGRSAPWWMRFSVEEPKVGTNGILVPSRLRRYSKILVLPDTRILVTPIQADWPAQGVLWGHPRHRNAAMLNATCRYLNAARLIAAAIAAHPASLGCRASL